MRMLRLLFVVPLILASPTTKSAQPAPLLISPANSQLAVDRYIVKLKGTSSLSVMEDLLSSIGSKMRHKYDNVFKGFAANLNDTMLNIVRGHIGVLIIYTIIIIRSLRPVANNILQRRSSMLNRIEPLPSTVSSHKPARLGV